MTQKAATPGINQLTQPLTRALVERADLLRLAVSRLDNGCRIIDAGINATGGLEAGRLIAEICMGGLGRVGLSASAGAGNWPWRLDVHSANPVMACLASQYAGWRLHHGEGKAAFNALGSGPARALGSNEALYEELNYRDKFAAATLVVEAAESPPVELAGMIANRCGLEASALTIILTPSTSLAGAVQVVARVLETALHKAHALNFPLAKIIDGAGSAPVCPPSRDFLTALGRGNDAILFGGTVQLFVEASDTEAEQLAHKLPSSASADYGKPFAEIFKDAGYDFYKIDPMLFSPARVVVSSLTSGRSFHAGRIDPDLLDQSFNGPG